MPTLDEAADALYARPPGEFVAERTAWVGRARQDGDTALAKQIGALRRPTAAAHAVNLLTRRSGALDGLRDLGERLRAAQSRMDVDAMRALTRERSQLVDRLTREAADAEEENATSAATQEQLRETFTAALADPAAEQAVCSGRLVTALSYAGLGEVDLQGAVATRLTLVPGGRSGGRTADDETGTAEEDTDGSQEAGESDGKASADPKDSAQDETAETSAEGGELDDNDDEALLAAQQRMEDAEAALSEADEQMRDAEDELAEAREELGRARDRLSAAMARRDSAREERTSARRERRAAQAAVRRARR